MNKEQLKEAIKEANNIPEKGVTIISFPEVNDLHTLQHLQDQFKALEEENPNFDFGEYVIIPERVETYELEKLLTEDLEDE